MERGGKKGSPKQSSPQLYPVSFLRSTGIFRVVVQIQTQNKIKQDLKLACRNVSTIHDKANSNHAQRRSAHIVHEPSSLDIDIEALCDFLLADDGSLQEADAGFAHIWLGKPSSD